VSIIQCPKGYKKTMCSDIHIMEQKNIIGSYDFLVGSRALNAKFTPIFVFMLLAYVLSSSFIANANVIANPSLILKASLALRMVLQDLLRGCD
jgi:hypothetical protein